MQTTNAVPKCQYCGSASPHQGICPSVKAIEYYPDGTTKRVELKTANDYPPFDVQAPWTVTSGPSPAREYRAPWPTSFHPFG